MLDRYRMWHRHLLMFIKTTGVNTAEKPTPMQEADVMRCVEAAQSPYVTNMYGRIIAFLKSLVGCRNPVFAASQWGHIHFVPTVLCESGEGEGQVRLPAAKVLPGCHCGPALRLGGAVR